MEGTVRAHQTRWRVRFFWPVEPLMLLLGYHVWTEVAILANGTLRWRTWLAHPWMPGHVWFEDERMTNWDRHWTLAEGGEG